MTSWQAVKPVQLPLVSFATIFEISGQKWEGNHRSPTWPPRNEISAGQLPGLSQRGESSAKFPPSGVRAPETPGRFASAFRVTRGCGSRTCRCLSSSAFLFDWSRDNGRKQGSTRLKCSGRGKRAAIKSSRRDTGTPSRRAIKRPPPSSCGYLCCRRPSRIRRRRSCRPRRGRRTGWSCRRSAAAGPP